MFILKQTLFIIVGRSGTGKSSLVRYYGERNHSAKIIVTTTTRPMRDGEVDGVHYNFKTKEEFEKMIAEDNFIEYTQYNGNYYGTSKDEFDSTRTNIIVLELNGLLKIKELMSDKFIIHVIKLDAPDHIILERLLQRNISVEEIARRFRDDKVKFEEDRFYYDVMMNTEFSIWESNMMLEEYIKTNSIQFPQEENQND
jgi:guanylate kinase